MNTQTNTLPKADILVRVFKQLCKLPATFEIKQILQPVDTTFRSQPAQIQRLKLVPGVAQRRVPLIAPNAAEVG